MEMPNQKIKADLNGETMVWIVSFSKDGTAKTTTDETKAKVFTFSGSKRVASLIKAHGYFAVRVAA